MFDNEIAINELQLGLFASIAADIPEDQLFSPGAGHGHPPAWILGHLAVTGEMGCQLLGGSLVHDDWISEFGPGSSDFVQPRSDLSKDVLVSAVTSAYESLRTMARNADANVTERPHGIELFANTPVKTVSHAVALLLTNHFGFHLAQLSSCRREQGHAALF